MLFLQEGRGEGRSLGYLRGGGGVWVHLPKVLALKLQKICSHSPRQEEWRRRCRRSREGRGKGWGEESGGYLRGGGRSLGGALA